MIKKFEVFGWQLEIRLYNAHTAAHKLTQEILAQKILAHAESRPDGTISQIGLVKGARRYDTTLSLREAKELTDFLFECSQGRFIKIRDDIKIKDDI